MSERDSKAEIRPHILAYPIDSFFYGVLVLQVYMYHFSFPNDRKWQKILVYFVFSFSTLETILQLSDMVQLFADDFDTPGAFTKIRTSSALLPIFTGIVSCAVQLFYSYQIYIAFHSKILGTTIAAISVFQTSVAIAHGVRAFQLADLRVLRQRSFVTFSIWLIGSAVCDIIIAISMTIYLLCTDSDLKYTHAPLRKLLRLIIETGTASATFATLGSVIFLAIPTKTGVHHIFVKCLVNVYSNSLLMVLNGRTWVSETRPRLRHQSSTIPIDTISEAIDFTNIRFTTQESGSKGTSTSGTSSRLQGSSNVSSASGEMPTHFDAQIA
ncbi:hypothetical protein K435DRAFT_762864 [Dendrothele bispora CBS 962.96]|uniref:DUF6534 domain-containing protein n=1 Tax=Dendrothele bispora (strain CBS 962.96) TaxID=1314807 RepID=A0A4S8LDW5_DENBC|nr:hypothetical protein K435DRAFT_762864 [Dendrothele bispora CBS 962.96]